MNYSCPLKAATAPECVAAQVRQVLVGSNRLHELLLQGVGALVPLQGKVLARLHHIE
jgi:hypothetical protein